MTEGANTQSIDVYATTKDILATIDREREREIVSRRFGLNDRRETLEQIGELLGITRERVRQIQMDALARLRKVLESHGLSEEAFLD